jgi:hypothetical protein
VLEIAKKLERLASGLQPEVLIGIGVATVLIGLFIWLGGLGWKRVLVFVSGAVCGGVCGLIFLGEHPVQALVPAAIGGLVAIIIEKAFITLLTAAFAGVTAFIVLSEYNKIHLTGSLNEIVSAMPAKGWLVIGASALVFIISGFHLFRLVSALCCAFLGTCMVFAGMIVLLSYKGAQPVDKISAQAAFYGFIFLGMVAFGTIEQLLLCGHRHKAAEPKKAKVSDKAKEEGGEQVQNWRTQ